MKKIEKELKKGVIYKAPKDCGLFIDNKVLKVLDYNLNFKIGDFISYRREGGKPSSFAIFCKYVYSGRDANFEPIIGYSSTYNRLFEGRISGVFDSIKGWEYSTEEEKEAFLKIMEKNERYYDFDRQQLMCLEMKNYKFKPLLFKDTMLNPDQKKVDYIIKRIEANNGICFGFNSIHRLEDKPCPCITYRCNQICQTELYVEKRTI